MAFSATNLSRIAGANGFTSWHYRSTSDSLATIMADGYFDTVANIMNAGDKITIKASDGVWEDVVESVVATVGSEDVAIGVQVLDVTDSTGTDTHRLGAVRKRWDGSEWMRLQADEAVTELDVVIIQRDGGAELVDTTSAAASTGTGKQCAVVAEGTPTQAVATGDFFWGCIFAPGTAGVKFNAVASVEQGQELYVSGTAGSLTDVFDGDVAVRGIVSLEEDDVEPVGAITYPYIVNTIDS